MLRYDLYFDYYQKHKPLRNMVSMRLDQTIDVFEKCPYISRGDITDI